MSEEQKYSMRFYNVLIYFGLYGGALLNMVSGMRYATGRIYETPYMTAQDVYALFPALRYMNIIYGVISMVMGLFAIYVRNHLRDYRKRGPMLYYILLVSMIAAPLIYLILTLCLYGNNLTWMEWLEYGLELISQLIVLYASYIYFSKRKSLFVR